MNITSFPSANQILLQKMIEYEKEVSAVKIRLVGLAVLELCCQQLDYW